MKGRYDEEHRECVGETCLVMGRYSGVLGVEPRSLKTPKSLKFNPGHCSPGP